MDNQEIQEYYEFYNKVLPALGSGSAEDFVSIGNEISQNGMLTEWNNGLDKLMAGLEQDYISAFASRYPERFLEEVRNNTCFTFRFHINIAALLFESVIKNRQEAELCLKAVGMFCGPNAISPVSYDHNDVYEKICNDSLRLAVLSENHDFIRKWIATVEKTMAILGWETLFVLISSGRSDILDMLIANSAVVTIQDMCLDWKISDIYNTKIKILDWVEVVYFITSRYLVKNGDEKRSAELTAEFIDQAGLLRKFAFGWGFDDQRKDLEEELLHLTKFLKEHDIMLNNFTEFVEYAYLDSSGEYSSYILEYVKPIFSDDPYITVEAFANNSRIIVKFLKKIGIENVLLDITGDSVPDDMRLDMKPFMKLPVRVRAEKDIAESKAAPLLVLNPSLMEFVLDRVEISEEGLNALTDRCIREKAFAALNVINRKMQSMLFQN